MVDTSAFDQPEARGLRSIVGSLRVVTAAQCFGAAGLQFLNAGESGVLEMLQEGGRALPADIATMDRVVGGLLFACGMFSLTRPCWPVLLPVTLWFTADAVTALVGGEGWPIYPGIAAAAASVLIPATLMIVDLYPPRAKFSLMRFMAGGFFARTAAVVSFCGVGVQALYQARHDGDLATTVRKAGWVLTGETPSQDVSAYALLLLGAISVGGAINLLVARARGLAAAMVILGLFIAGSNVFLYGPAGMLHFLKGFALPGAPLVVFLYWTLSIREQVGQLRPKGG